MQNLNVPLVVLTGLTLFHFLIGSIRLAFPIKSRFHLNRCAFLIAKWTECVIIVAYIIYDNIKNPPHGGWGLSAIGYSIVFLMWMLMWMAYAKHTYFKKNETYRMVIKGEKKTFSLRLPNGTMKDTVFQKGYINNHEVYIPLPLEPYQEDSTVKVKFDCVYNVDDIFVSPTEDQNVTPETPED